MNYKKVLEKLGFIEGTDFALVGESFEMLQQSKMVNQYIFHPAIEATYHDVEISPEIPAVLDGEGIEITPLVPAVIESQILTPYVAEWNEKVLIHHEAVPAVLDENDNVIVMAIAAYDEEVMIEELFTLTSPSVEVLESTWKNIQIAEVGIRFLIEEYLKDKRHLINSENDSLNVGDEVIFNWSFVNIPQPTVDELIALIPTVSANILLETLVNEKASIGEKLGLDCQKCLNAITGFNDGRLSGAQIQTMLSTFANINLALTNKMPKTAKALLLQVVPDGTIVTQEMKDVCLYILKDYVLS